MGPRPKENWHRIMLMEQTQEVPIVPHECSKCRIGSGSNNSDNVDVGPMQLEVDINDALVGATGVQFTEQVGIEIEPGIPYYFTSGILGGDNTQHVSRYGLRMQENESRWRRTALVRTTRSIV